MLEDDLVTVQYYLRAITSYQFQEATLELGSRESKSYFIVQKTQQPDAGKKLLAMVPGEQAVLSLASDSRKAAIFSLLRAIQHPHIHRVEDIDYMKDAKKVLVFRSFNGKGSLKDKIYRCDPMKKTWGERYVQGKGGQEVVGQKLSNKEISKCGNQILQALSFLKSIGYPYPHLHTCNVLMDKDENCKLTDLENSLLGLQPHYGPVKKGEKLFQDTVTRFGNVLWEMAVGSARTPDHELKDIQSQCSPVVYKILEQIEEKKVETVDDLLVMEFFAGPLKQPPMIEIDKKKLKVMEVARASICGELQPSDHQPARKKSSASLKTSSSKENLKAASTSATPAQPKEASVKKTKKSTAKKTASQETLAAPPPPPPTSAPAPPPAPAPAAPTPNTARGALLASIRDPSNKSKLKKVK